MTRPGRPGRPARPATLLALALLENAVQVVRQIIGGDPAFWSCSIAS